MLIVVVDNKTFDEVYSKLINKSEVFIRNNRKINQAGFILNESKLITLSIYLNYLENIKSSKYTYYYVDKLTAISNFLNTL